MIIELKQLQLTNFKGVRDLTVEFAHETNVFGMNKAGKTTLMDAFLFCLFGKDSAGSADFNIKTLDETGKAIPQIDHSVTATMTVDGVEVTLKRLYREKWTRRRGSEETELTGHETLFYKNEVPMQAGEYKTMISGMVDEGLFKLVTSSTAFNALPWQKRREVLIQIAGTITDADIMGSLTKAQIKDLTNILNQGKDFVQYRKEVAVKKKKLADDLKAIPARVDECKRSIPEPVNFEQVKNDLYSKQQSLLEIELALSDKVTAYDEQAKGVQMKQKEINTLRSRLQQIEFEAKTEAQKDGNEQQFIINNLKQQGSGMVLTLKGYKATLEQLQAQKDSTETKLTTLREQYNKVSDEQLIFDPNKFVCPTCKRELDPATIGTQKEVMTADFEKNQTHRLGEIQTEGKRLSALLPEIDQQIAATSQAIAEHEVKIQELAAKVRESEAVPTTPTEVALPPEHADVIKEIETLQLQVLEVPQLDVTGLKVQKGQIQAEIDTMKHTLAAEEVIKRGNTRVKELLAEEKSLAQQISDLERSEFAMAAYESSQMNMVESRVNEKFETVRFKLFNNLINGGVELCCEATVGGVPVNSDLNGAGRVQAGLEIIRVLSDHYGVYLPCFCDNRESCTEIPAMKCQIINLFVSPEDKTLRIG